MPIIEIELVATGYHRKAKARFNFTTAYDSETNKTTVNFGSGVFSAREVPASISAVRASITVAAADNADSFAKSNISRRILGAPVLSEVPIPKTVTVQHGFGNVEKYITVSISVTLELSTSNGVSKALGHVTRTIYVGLDGIVHVGDKVGSLYVAIDGKWHIGVIHAADGGKFYPSVGYILSAPEKGIEVTYDDAGNVFISGVRVTHDEKGNVSLIGATVEDDGDGHITIK